MRTTTLKEFLNDSFESLEFEKESYFKEFEELYDGDYIRVQKSFAEAIDVVAGDEEVSTKWLKLPEDKQVLVLKVIGAALYSGRLEVWITHRESATPQLELRKIGV